MLPTLSRSILINRNIDEVFNFICNYENDIKWRSGILQIMQIPSGSIEVGTTIREVVKHFGRNMVITYEITELIPGKKISHKVFSGMIPATGYRLLEEVDGSTKVTYSLSPELKGFYKIFSSVVLKDFNKRIGEDLMKLKNILE